MTWILGAALLATVCVVGGLEDDLGFSSANGFICDFLTDRLVQPNMLPFKLLIVPAELLGGGGANEVPGFGR